MRVCLSVSCLVVCLFVCCLRVCLIVSLLFGLVRVFGWLFD